MEVLKLLQKTYYNKIKMIYIDPPYNTGNDFIYSDNYTDNLENYLEITRQIEKNNNEVYKITTNTETLGRFHSNWLNMLYPRLKLSRNLLSDDGVIFISINDNELENLKKICNEIFGENNFLGNLIIKSNPGGRDYGGIALTHEYVLCYSKTNQINLNMVLDKQKKFKYHDSTGGFDLRELRNRNKRFNIDNRPNLCYPFYVNPKNKDKDSLFEISLKKNPNYVEVMPLISQGVQTVWRWGKEKSQNNLNINIKAKLKKDGSFMIVEKYRNAYKRERSIWDESSVRNENGTLTIKNLFNSNVFDYPKSPSTIERLISLGSNENSLILDFFAGSSTTAHAIMNINANDSKNLKYIMVQFPEEISQNSEAYEKGYKTICEISEERIRRAGDKIVEESGNDELDIGFKVFKLGSSNLTKWNPNIDNLENSLISNEDNIISDRTKLDLVYEIMLKYGIDLTVPVEEISIKNKMVYSVGFGALLICLDDDISSNLADDIIKVKENLDSTITRVVFKDKGFKSDSDKTNIKETFRANNITEFITI